MSPYYIYSINEHKIVIMSHNDPDYVLILRPSASLFVDLAREGRIENKFKYYCKCGRIIKNYDKYCSNCGKKIK
jgi:hypothetical protein